MTAAETALPTAKPIAGSTLDRNHMHVFVCGPGVGEGVAVALPGSGWIVVDGCEVAGATGGRDPTLLRLVKELRGEDDPVELAVLTHPHEDHAQGFAKTIEELCPREIMVTAKAATGPHLLEIAKRLYEDQKTATTSSTLNENAPVVSALRAMEGWGVTTNKPLTAGVDGVMLSLQSGARVTVRLRSRARTLTAYSTTAYSTNLLRETEVRPTRRASSSREPGREC